MNIKIEKYVASLFALICFIFLVKIFYFDTKLGFETQIFELQYSAVPMFVDVIITIIFTTFLVYSLLEEIFADLLKSLQLYLTN